MTEAESIEEKIQRYYDQPYTPRFRADARSWNRDLREGEAPIISYEEFQDLRTRLQQISQQ